MYRNSRYKPMTAREYYLLQGGIEVIACLDSTIRRTEVSFYK